LLGISSLTKETLAEVFRRCNVDAYNVRYGESLKSDLRFKSFGEDLTKVQKVQAYKSLVCLIYQCSEGNIPETIEYGLLVRLKGDIVKDLGMGAEDLIRRSEVYDDADWG
jgi:hypothetical protein